jgi:hypothetical protein
MRRFRHQISIVCRHCFCLDLLPLGLWGALKAPDTMPGERSRQCVTLASKACGRGLRK